MLLVASSDVDTSSSVDGFVVLLGIIPAFFSYFAFNVPFWLTLVYLIFGSEFIIFAWIDEVLAFLITHWVSNMTPLIHIFSIFVFLLFITTADAAAGLNMFFYIMIVFETLIGYFYTKRTIESSGDACRHLNPQWDFIPRGDKLYPTILYLFGIKDRRKEGSGRNPDDYK